VLGLVVSKESIVALLDIDGDGELGGLGFQRPESSSENGSVEVD